ncbi:MAG: SPASM domain-containing protein [Clostridiales bacterium]|nr:SPASM domain-containing protein [Clostridiales bacterium]
MTEPTFRPNNFMLIPTAACQASCVYCFGPNRGETMSASVADWALAFMARIAPAEGNVYVTFHGGEPLLAGVDYYESILPNLKELFGRRLRLSMQTNLLAMNERIADLIREYRIAVGTSVDGDEALCDAQRGDGYYAANERGRNLLQQKGVDVSRICTLTHRSAGEAVRVFRHYAGAPPLTGHPYSLHGAVRTLGKEPDAHTVTADDMARILLDTLEAYRQSMAQTRVSTMDAMAKGCFDGEGRVCTFFPCLGRFAAIAPDGGVYACQRFCGHPEFKLGNVTDGLTQEQILLSEAYQMLYRKQEHAKEACGDCMHFAYCSGGCLYNMCAADARKDPYCQAYRAVFDRIARDMALEMGRLMTKQITPERAPLLQMAGDLPHPYDLAVNQQRRRRAVNWGRYPLGASQTLEVCKRNRVQEFNKLYLHITFHCPLRCDHCYASAGETDMPEMAAEAALGVISDAQKALFRSAVVTGGEPLAHREIDTLLEGITRLDQKGMRLILRTSLGFSIGDDRLKAICDAFPEIVVSVDGDEASHDSRRGQGRYAKTIENLERIKDLGFIDRVGVCATLQKSQRDGHEGRAVTALCKRLGIRNIRFHSVLPLGRAIGTAPDADFDCVDESEENRPFRPRFSCGLGQNLYVEPDGGAYPCYAWCGPDKCLGNVLSDGLAAILDGADFRELSRHDVDTNEKCRTCEVRYLCGGMCKAWSTDQANIDGDGFDCTARKTAYEHLASMLK